MKKVYTQTKKVPACPRCEDIAAWKHDAKGRWWCKTCNKAFTPGITGANLASGRAHANSKKQEQQKQQDPMRITRNKLKDEESSEDLQYGSLDNQVMIKSEDSNDTNARRLAKSQEYYPSTASSPGNKIRKLTARRASADRFRQMLADDEFSLEETGDDQDSSEEKQEVVRVRSERPKKSPYACPHTDKPYYAKGKCRPCYWAEWRREGGKKGHAAKLAAEQQQQQQLAFDAGASPDSKLNKRKKKGSFASYDAMMTQPKKAVAIDDAQCVAFRLNKASDYQAIHDLLLELRSFYITGEILKGSHLLLVVKRLTQNPSSAVSELAKALFEEFAEILNEQRPSGENSPMSITTDNDSDTSINMDPSTPTKEPTFQTNIMQTNYVNTNFTPYTTVPFNGAPADFGTSSFNTGFQTNNLQSPMFVQQPAFQMQTQPNPSFNQSTPPVPPPQPTTTKRGRRAANTQQPQQQPTTTNVASFVPTSYTMTPTDPLATLLMNNNTNMSFTPVSNPMGIPNHPPIVGSLPVLQQPMTGNLQANTSNPNQMRLVQEITMMNSTLAQLTNMNYNMLNNLNTMRTQNNIRQQNNFPTTPNTSTPNLGQLYVNPNAFTMQPNYSYPQMAMPNYVSYATTPYDASMSTMSVSDLPSDVSNSQTELDPAQLVESMLQQDDDDASDELNGNHTLECTDYNHSPIITNIMEALSSSTDAIKAEQSTLPPSTSLSTPTPSDETTSRDNFISEMTSDTSSCSAHELELSDNYLTFLA